MDIAMIGAGSVGESFGERLVRSGYRVRFGVRPGKDVGDLLRKLGDGAIALPVAEAVDGADMVLLAVPAKAAVAALDGAALDGKIVVDCTNPVGWDEGPVWEPPAEGSVTAQLAAARPEARWVKGFATFGAEIHRDPGVDGHVADVHVAGDDLEAKRKVADLARGAGFVPVDAGPLRNAAVLENLAILWIHLANIGGLGREWMFKIVRRT